MKRMMKGLATTIAAGTLTATLISPVAPAQPAPAVNWVACPADTVTRTDVECGEIQVPMDYSKPQGQKITVGFIRNKSGNSRGAVFTNPGGPGGDAYQFLGSKELADLSLLENEWDMIGVQPRGLRGSTGVDCVDNMMTANPVESIFNSGALTRQACANSALPGYTRQITTENTARDWEEVRKALGYNKINILGLSYGTILGSVYATKYPQNTDKVVLDSGLDPNSLWPTVMAAQERGYYGSIYAFFEYVAQNNDRFRLGATPYQVWERWSNKIQRESGARPTVVPPKAQLQDLPRELRAGGQVAVDTFNNTAAARVQAEGLGTQVTSGGGNQATSITLGLTRQIVPFPRDWDELALHVNGSKDLMDQPGGLEISDELAEYSINAQLMQNLIMCNESHAPTNPFEWPRGLWTGYVTGDVISAPPAMFASGAMCQGAAPVTRIPALNGAALATKPLQIQATNDPQTPYHLHGPMARSMRSTVVTVDGPGHGHVGFGNDAVTRIAADYLRTGTVSQTRVAGLH